MIEQPYFRDPDYVYLTNKIKNIYSIYRKISSLNANFKFEEKGIVIIIGDLKYIYSGFEISSINNSLKTFCFNYKFKKNHEIVQLVKRLVYVRQLFELNRLYSQKSLFHLIKDVKEKRSDLRDVLLSEVL